MKLHLLPSGVTDELQTIDDGVGVMTKNHMGKSFTRWLEEVDGSGRTNLDRMLHGDVSASERRILLTKWLGDAWDYVLSHYDMVHSGEKTGCCMDIQGTNFHKIKLQGLEEDYFFGPEHHGPEANSSDDEREEGGSDLEAAENASQSTRDDMDDLEIDEEHPPSTEESEVEDCTGPENVDENDCFVVPDGYEVVDAPPFDFTLRNLKQLNLRLALKWAYGEMWGWPIY
jgi:hypothetical protein